MAGVVECLCSGHLHCGFLLDAFIGKQDSLRESAPIVAVLLKYLRRRPTFYDDRYYFVDFRSAGTTRSDVSKYGGFSLSSCATLRIIATGIRSLDEKSIRSR
jgi:hypothetical protein